MSRSIAITGATGYLGSRLELSFRSAGWEVIRLVRKPSRPSDRRMVLGQPFDPGILDGADVLIHAAYDMRAVSKADIWRINVAGCRHLLDAAATAHVGRVLVLSSMSAYAGTRQLYGRAKLEIEEMTREAGGLAIRPGLVIGRPPGGMAKALAALVRLPVTPSLSGVGGQFPVIEEDFLSACLALAEQEPLPRGPIGLAHTDPLSFSDLLCSLARYTGVRPPRLVPVPWRLADFALKAAEALRVPAPLRSDSLLGLVEPAPFVPEADYWSSIGVRIRSVAQELNA